MGVNNEISSSLIKYKTASMFTWDSVEVKGGNHDSEEFEFISKELGIKKVCYTLGIPNVDRFVSKNKSNFQVLETIDGNKIFLGQFYPSSDNFIAVVAKNKSSSLIAIDEKMISDFEAFYKSHS